MDDNIVHYESQNSPTEIKANLPDYLLKNPFFFNFLWVYKVTGVSPYNIGGVYQHLYQF